jgi:LuxR family transcriptional regulator, maltose regulon positive regulatory protein
MQNSLLTTKLYFPPARASLVLRPRLIERLQTGLRGPLTLVSAPAGSGKTTILSEWRAGPGTHYPVAWLSLDAADNDPLRFLQYLSAALDTLQPEVMRDTQILLQGTEKPNGEAILTMLVNALGVFPQDFAMVLDDYQVIETPIIHNILTFLLDHLPTRMHLILLTRSDPALPLARLRARGQLTEIRDEHLRFTVEESARFLNTVMGLDLSSEQVAALEKRTEGWITGLQLAALSMQGREDVQGFVSAFAGGHRYIVDFLTEEVLDRQPKYVSDFLVKTSILGRFCAPLCDAVVGGTSSESVLRELERANLFLIPLDTQQCWYRYHHLFADVLYNRLLHSLPEQKKELHSRAAIWLEQNGFLDQAIDHTLAACNFEGAYTLLAGAWAESRSRITMWETGHGYATIQRWLDAFPPDFYLTHPELALSKARLLWMLGQLDKIEACFQVAESGFNQRVADKRISPDDVQLRSYRAEILATRSKMLSVKGDHEAAITCARQALELAPVDDRDICAAAYMSLYQAYRELGHFEEAGEACRNGLSVAMENGTPGVVMDLFNGLGLIYQVQARLNQAEQTYLQALRYAHEHHCLWLPQVSITYIEIGNICYFRNKLEDARTYLEKGLDLCSKNGHHVVGLYGRIHLSRLQYARGEPLAALETIRKVEQSARETGVLTITDEFGAHLAWMESESGDPVRASIWVRAQNLKIGERLGVVQGICAIHAARVMLRLEQFEEALSLLSHIEKAARMSGAISRQLESLVLQAVAFHRIGETVKALSRLEKALQLAEAEGSLRIFLNEGAPMISLLRSINRKNANPEFSTLLLSEFSKRPSGKNVPAQGAVRDSLSKRELELLRLVASGCSNKEIASQLVISLATVKRHTVNIFNKLDVKNRTEAVARARELGLL